METATAKSAAEAAAMTSATKSAAATMAAASSKATAASAASSSGSGHNQFLLKRYEFDLLPYFTILSGKIEHCFLNIA